MMCHDKWVPVTTAWHIVRLQMEEQPLILKVAMNILNKQSWTADKGWPSSLADGRGANNSPQKKLAFLQKWICALILWYKLSNGKGT